MASPHAVAVSVQQTNVTLNRLYTVVNNAEAYKHDSVGAEGDRNSLSSAANLCR
jgi:hypothetical protein